LANFFLRTTEGKSYS